MRKLIVAITSLAGAAGLAISGAALGVQAPDSAEAKINADSVRLSASEINAFLSGDARSVPDNCEVYYNPFTGECSAVVCTSQTGWKTIYECSEFGL